MATLGIQTIVLAGLDDPSFGAAAAGGDNFPNDAKGSQTFIYLKNGDGTTTDVTFDDTGSTGPDEATAFDPDVVVTVPAGGESLVGPFDATRFGFSVGMTYEKVTSLTVAAFTI